MPFDCLAASPPTRGPRLPLPALACDAHFHIFADPDRYPFGAPRDYTPPGASIDAYRNLCSVLGLQRHVIVQPSVYGTDNRCTLDAMAALSPERCRAVVVLDPAVTATELQRMDDLGVRGARVNLVNAGGTSIEELDNLSRKIAPLGWHLQVYVNGSLLPGLVHRLARLPIPVVVDHMGQIFQDSPTYREEIDALRRLLEVGSAWVKLCGYRASRQGRVYADVAPLARELVATAPERCLWGTDWPHPGLRDAMPDDADLVDLLATWTPLGEVRQRILVDNPDELYRFAP